MNLILFCGSHIFIDIIAECLFWIDNGIATFNFMQENICVFLLFLCQRSKGFVKFIECLLQFLLIHLILCKQLKILCKAGIHVVFVDAAGINLCQIGFNLEWDIILAAITGFISFKQFFITHCKDEICILIRDDLDEFCIRITIVHSNPCTFAASRY